MKFYVKEAFYLCASFHSDQNCHKWDEENRNWIDTGSGPNAVHNTGAIVPFPDGRVALISGRVSSNNYPYNSLMELNDTWTDLVPFDVPIGYVGGCAISDSELIAVGGVLNWSPIIRTNQAWLFNINDNTKTALSNMTFVRDRAACANINSNQVLVVSQTGANAEVYDISLNTWTISSQFTMRERYPALHNLNNRLFYLAGGNSNKVWEWNESVGSWMEKPKRLPEMTYTYA